MLPESSLKLPIKRIEIYKNDVVLTYVDIHDDTNHRGDRRAISKLSRRSLLKLAFTAQNTAVEFTHMLTLTYPREFTSNGKTVKSHLNRILTWMRARGLETYLWFMEFQKRGAPHFHILLNMSGYEVSEIQIRERWYKAVDSGDRRHLEHGARLEKLRSKDGAARYATKYAQKTEQKSVPQKYQDVGRFWGCSRNVKPEASKVVEVGEMSPDTLADTLCGAGWEYWKVVANMPVKVLYNASKYILGESDNGDTTG